MVPRPWISQAWPRRGGASGGVWWWAGELRRPPYLHRSRSFDHSRLPHAVHAPFASSLRRAAPMEVQRRQALPGRIRVDNSEGVLATGRMAGRPGGGGPAAGALCGPPGGPLRPVPPHQGCHRGDRGLSRQFCKGKTLHNRNSFICTAKGLRLFPTAAAAATAARPPARFHVGEGNSCSFVFYCFVAKRED